jgi:hypothetical protein
MAFTKLKTLFDNFSDVQKNTYGTDKLAQSIAILV